MEPLGRYLKTERELRNLSLVQVAGFTRVREHLLKAIEEDRYDLLPHPLYVKGYLGAYARYLGLNPGDIILHYKNYLKSLEPPLPQESQIQTPLKPIWILKVKNKPRLFALKMIAGGLLFVLFAFYGLYELSQWGLTSPVEKESFFVQSKAEAQKAVEAIQKGISIVGETEARDVIPIEASAYEVLDVNIGKGIELESGRSVLKERCSEFSCNNQRAYFFTKIKAQREGRIIHLWYREGKEFHRAEIEVKPPAWMVYSYITLRPGYAGNWMAEIRDGNTILSNLNFKAIEAFLHE